MSESTGFKSDRAKATIRPDAVRRARTEDLDAMAAMAAELVRFHHGLDAARFFVVKNVEKGYRGWFGQEITNSQAILLVGELDGAVCGYAYGRIEPRDWNMLLDRHAALHDVFAKPEARGTGLAEALVRAFLSAAREAGAPRVVLHSASANGRAQALFARVGFRPTMVEMMADFDAEPAGGDVTPSSGEP